MVWFSACSGLYIESAKCHLLILDMSNSLLPIPRRQIPRISQTESYPIGFKLLRGRQSRTSIYDQKRLQAVIKFHSHHVPERLRRKFQSSCNCPVIMRGPLYSLPQPCVVANFSKAYCVLRSGYYRLIMDRYPMSASGERLEGIKHAFMFGWQS